MNSFVLHIINHSLKGAINLTYRLCSVRFFDFNVIYFKLSHNFEYSLKLQSII